LEEPTERTPQNRYDVANEYWRSLTLRYPELRAGQAGGLPHLPPTEMIVAIAVLLVHPQTRPLIADLLDGIIRRVVFREGGT
jgi:hypothetical protein